MNFQQISETGCRLVGAITKLGNTGPKHHAIVIGKSAEDGATYVAENCHDAYKLATYEEFAKRYSENDEIHIYPNDGKFTDIEVAQRALNEIVNGGTGKYDLAINNCESFSNRAMHGHSVSNQVINTVFGIAAMVGAFWIIKRTKRA